MTFFRDIYHQFKETYACTNDNILIDFHPKLAKFFSFSQSISMSVSLEKAINRKIAALFHRYNWIEKKVSHHFHLKSMVIASLFAAKILVFALHGNCFIKYQMFQQKFTRFICTFIPVFVVISFERVNFLPSFNHIFLSTGMWRNARKKVICE